MIPTVNHWHDPDVNHDDNNDDYNDDDDDDDDDNSDDYDDDDDDDENDGECGGDYSYVLMLKSHSVFFLFISLIYPAFRFVRFTHCCVCAFALGLGHTFRVAISLACTLRAPFLRF